MREGAAEVCWTMAGAAAFGAAVGSYVGGRQILYAAVKMPVFLLGTGTLCAGAILAVSAARVSPAEAARIALGAVGSTARMLAALAAPLFLAGISMPKPEPRGYAGMVMLLTAAVALAGGISVMKLRRDLPSTPLWLAWIGLYGFTGAQMAWLLKPWIGCTLNDDRFLPIRENLRGNFYEAAWGTLHSLMR